MRNKYFWAAKISEDKFRTILRLFSLDIEAGKVAEFVCANRVSINNIYNKLRECIAALCEAGSPQPPGAEDCVTPLAANAKTII